MKRLVIVVTTVALVAAMVGCGEPAPSAVVFADPNLEAAVREAIAKPEDPIYPSDLDGLTSFNATGKNIADLTGLEHATSLTQLYLGDNLWMSDISALAGLTGLEQLDLSCNHQISYLSPLANLTRLKSLYLQNNRITVISPLGNLTSLRLLSLWGNEIRDISPLADLTGLTQLYLAYNQIRDISPLASLSNLTYLDLEDNQIDDIFPLLENEEFSEGDQIDLRGNPLTADSISIYIPELEARGVIVTWQGGTSPHS